MAPRPGNRQRGTLSRQALVSQTESEVIETGFVRLGFGQVTLSIPVAGTSEGCRVKGFGGSIGAFDLPGVLVRPNQVEFATDDALLIVWIDNSGGLRTTSNGKISPRPLSFL